MKETLEIKSTILEWDVPLLCLVVPKSDGFYRPCLCVKSGDIYIVVRVTLEQLLKLEANKISFHVWLCTRRSWIKAKMSKSRNQVELLERFDEPIPETIWLKPKRMHNLACGENYTEAIAICRSIEQGTYNAT